MIMLANEKPLTTFGDLVTVAEAARQKGANANALRKWLRKKQVPTYRVGKSILVRLDQLTGYVPRKKRDTKK